MYVALTRLREILTVLYTHEDGLVPRLQSAMELYKKYRQRLRGRRKPGQPRAVPVKQPFKCHCEVHPGGLYQGLSWWS
jgi:hypothetical protein